MRRFLLPRSFAGQTRLTLAGADFRHLVRVLRLREGDAIPAMDAAGALHTLRIARVGRSECEVDVDPAVGRTDGAHRTAITLLQCLPKGKKIDLIVRQATEAGVARIVLVESERSLSGAGEGRLDRLRRVAREALQQSGSPNLPEIEGPRTLASLGGEPEGGWGTALFCHEERLEATSLHELLA
jgi:16S rRNA (uracil1498-N3)-methyltransferase